MSFLFGLTIYTAYSAKLISFLSVFKPSLPFSTIQDLLDSQQYSVGLARGSAYYSLFFEAPQGSFYKQVAEQLVSEDDLVDSFEEGFELTMARTNYAFVWDTISMPGKDSCQILEIPLDLDTNIVAMAWSPKLPHRHILDHFFGKIRESGQLSRILRANMPTTNKADCWGEGEFRSSLLNLSLYGLIFFRSMGLENTIAAFGLITAASIAATLIFLFELGVSWFRGKQ